MKLTSNYVENIIFGKRFVWNYFLAGLAISVLWMFILYKCKSTYFDGEEKRASAILSQFFSIIILTIFLNVFYTYQTGKENIYYKEAILTSVGSNMKTGTNYVNLLLDGRDERFSSKKHEIEVLTKGDTVLLKIGKGKTSYDIIYEFRKK
jgi:hypothetical protein